MFHCSQETHRFYNDSTGRARAGNLSLLLYLFHLCICLYNIIASHCSVSFYFLQNWVSFGKVAPDLVMHMQRIDGDNYPEVV